jgi:hypothetical protein
MLGLGSSLVTGGGVQGLIPSEISGLELHLKVNTGIVGNAGGASADGDMADGEDINSWADQSGRARHASQASAAKKPHWETDAADFGGLKWTDDTADPYMDLAQYSSADLVISANEDFTIMIRVKLTDFSTVMALIGDDGNDVIKWASNKLVKTLIGGTGAKSWEEASDVLATDTYYIHTLTRSDDATGNLTYHVHGGSYSDKSWDSSETHTDADEFTLSNIGSSSDGNLPAEGVFKDVIVWKGTALTSSQRADMYSYINGQEY